MRWSTTLDLRPGYKHILLSQWFDAKKNTEILMNTMNVYAFQLSIGAAVLCLPWLRWAQPNLPRPIRVPLVFPIVYLIATVFVTVVPMIATPVETGYGILMILTSLPVYMIFIAWRNKPKIVQCIMGEYFLQLILLLSEYDLVLANNLFCSLFFSYDQADLRKYFKNWCWLFDRRQIKRRFWTFLGDRSSFYISELLTISE